MWIFTKYGFFSAVCARQGSGKQGQDVMHVFRHSVESSLHVGSFLGHEKRRGHKPRLDQIGVRGLRRTPHPSVLCERLRTYSARVIEPSDTTSIGYLSIELNM